MVTGRESLIRLIGKRRRFLPNRQSILSNTSQSSLDLCADDNNGGIYLGKAVEQEPLQANLNEFEPSRDNEPENGECPGGEVDCPVCGSKISGDNSKINSHLDVCLSRGTKRKLTQCTLLQLNFIPISKVKIVPDDLVKSDNLSNESPVLAVQDKNEIESNTCEELTENPGIVHKIDSTSSSTSSLSLNNEIHYKPNIFGVTLETFIVGRRYTDQEEICPDTTISLLRDPQNIKDSNAIKVVSADSACCKLLGFLPRELAQYLSPLIDSYGLRFEGHVTSVSKHSLDVVPVQIMCHRSSTGESEYEDEIFKCLWKNAQDTVEFASRNPPSSVKYQLNFCLMLQEVLRNNSHLITEDEKTFMESFTSLSNDSQRLFIRLYTRKGSFGPWNERDSFPTTLVFGDHLNYRVPNASRLWILQF